MVYITEHIDGLGNLEIETSTMFILFQLVFVAVGLHAGGAVLGAGSYNFKLVNNWKKKLIPT